MLDKGEPGRPDVGGTRRLVEETIAGRKVQALRITRDTAKDTHNETGIVQEIERDVSAYRTISFTAWVKINRASLSGGGYLGSEYPMMFRVNYSDEKGGRPGWSHGFFYANPENRPTDGGELTRWHTHDALCVGYEDGSAIISLKLLGRPADASPVSGIEMMHVWLFDNPDGPLAPHLESRDVQALKNAGL